MLTLLKTDTKTKARLGKIKTAHGEIETPFFMPVGTNGTLKSLTIEDLLDFDSPIVLSNTYHLYLRPGMEIIKSAGGLHKFMSWERVILTDSGGYQVFSLTDFRKIIDDGVKFKSHIDGSSHFFTPESVIDIERALGSDMIMPLDVCAPYPCERKEAKKSVELTTKWAQRSKAHLDKNNDKGQLLFGIIQGATFEDLRRQSAQEILDIGFDGIAIGGVSVGEPVEEMFKTLDWVMPLLPSDKPHYFMGIGLPDQIVKAVGEGIDMFDTCIPTRYGRHGTALTSQGKIIVRNQEFADDKGPLDPNCKCIVCQRYSRSYLRHLSNMKELSGLRLISYHNVYFYVNLMRQIKAAIKEDRYLEFQKEFLKQWCQTPIIGV